MSYAKKRVLLFLVLMGIFLGASMPLCAMGPSEEEEDKRLDREIEALASEYQNMIGQRMAALGAQVSVEQADLEQKKLEAEVLREQQRQSDLVIAREIQNLAYAERNLVRRAERLANSPALPPVSNNPDEPRTEFLTTPLMEAAREGDSKKVKSLIAQKADVNARGADGFTALIYAAEKGHEDIVNMLLGAGADVHFRNHYGNTALRLAVGEQKCDMIALLLRNGAEKGIHVRGEHGRNALAEAILRGENDTEQSGEWPFIVKTLLDKEANVYLKTRSTDKHNRLLIWSASDDGILNEMVNSRIKKILRRECARGVHDSKSFASVMKDIEKGDQEACIKVIKGCVGSGSVSVDGKSPGCYRSLTDGATLLTRAAECGKASVVESLIRLGANLHDGNVLGDTALILAARNGHLVTVETLLDLDAKAQIDIDARNNEGSTALIEAARAGYLEVVKLLVGKRANTRIAMDHSMITAFMGSVAEGYYDIAHYLIQHGKEQISDIELRHALIMAELRGQKDADNERRTGNKKAEKFANMLRSEYWCGAPKCPQINPLNVCSKCNLKKYCSKKCQVEDWPTHKVRCGATPERGVGSAGKQGSEESKQVQPVGESAQNKQLQNKPAAKPDTGEIDCGHQVLVVSASDRVGNAKRKGPKQQRDNAQGWSDWNNKQQQGKDTQAKKCSHNKGAKQQGAHAKPRPSHGGNSASGPVCAPQGPLTRAEKERLRGVRQQSHTLPPEDHMSRADRELMRQALAQRDERRKQEERARQVQREEESQCAHEQEQAAALALPELDFNEQQGGDLGPVFLTVGKEVIAFKARHVFEGESGNRGLHHDYGLKREHAGDVVRLDNDHTFDEDANGCYRVTRNGEKKSMFPGSWTEKELKSRLQRALGGHGRCFSLPSKKRAGVMEVFGVMEASQAGEELFAPVYFKAITERRGVIGRPEVTCVITTVFPIAGEKFNKKYAEWGEAQELEAAIKMSLQEQQAQQAQDVSVELGDDSVVAAAQ